MPDTIVLQDTETLSRAGRDALDEALAHLTAAERSAYWSSVRKCYNAPYEDDGHKRRHRAPPAGGDDRRAGGALRP